MFRHDVRKIPLEIPFTEGGVLTEPYVKTTDAYTRETDITYIAPSENIRLEGHPFKKLDEKIPLVNPSRFNVVEIELPDMRKMMLPPFQGNLSLETEIPVWKLLGFRVDIGGPIQAALTGQKASALYGVDSGYKFTVPTENWTKTVKIVDYPGRKPFLTDIAEEESESDSEDGTAIAPQTDTVYWGMEHKQIQFVGVGCEPLLGVYEGKWLIVLLLFFH